MDELLAINAVSIEYLRTEYADNPDIIEALDCFGESLIGLLKTNQAITELRDRVLGGKVHPAAVEILARGAKTAYDAKRAEALACKAVVDHLIAGARGEARYEA